MTTMPDAKRLELSVSNFGPIAEGRVELRPFTVFVGPSNTGKSYLATLIYALHRFFASYSQESRTTSALGGFAMPRAHGIGLSNEDISELYEWQNSLHVRLAQAGPDRVSLDQSALPDSIAQIARRVIRNSSGESMVLGYELVRCFFVDNSEQLVHLPGGADARISLCRGPQHEPGGISLFRYEAIMAEQGVSIHASISDDMPVYVPEEVQFVQYFLSPDDTEDRKANKAQIFLGILVGAALARSVGSLGKLAHYLPADRAGAVRSHSALTEALISRASRPASASQRPTFSGMYGDFLERLVGLGNTRTKPVASVEHLSEKMERNILDGEIWIDTNPVGYPSFFYRPKKWDHDLPLMNASSMVSELAPVVLYLRHVVQPGETLIIEEPESALHPAMQVEFTRLLAAAVKAGIRIIITTHSEWVLEELANLLLMSELPEDQRHGFEGADLALGPEELGIWSFQPTEEGSVVEELCFDEEVGKFPSDAGLITTELYNRYARISNRIERLKEG